MPDRYVEIRLVRAHEDNAENKRVNKLFKMWAKLSIDVMVKDPIHQLE